MKLCIPNGELTLPKGFSFEIHADNPFFSDEGVRSLPVNLPANPENLFLLGFPNRIGRRKRFNKKVAAILSHGPFQLAGTLVIDSVSITEGISCSLTLSESEFYTKHQDKMLKDLLAGYETHLGISKVDGVASNGEVGLVNHLWDVYSDTEVAHLKLEGFAIFPVHTSDGYGSCVLNQPNESDNGFVYAERSITAADNITEAVPNGYGVTPFVYLWKMLEWVFGICGYKISYNVFSDPESIFSKVVILNSCADALIPSATSVKWSDLVPSITVGDLIVWLKDKFGAGVFVHGNNIEIRQLQDRLSSTPDINMSEYVRGDILISYPESSRMVINLDTSIEGAKPITETLVDFVANYPKPIKSYEDSNEDGFHYNPVTGTYYRIVGGAKAILGSNAFAYDRKNSSESEEIKTDDQYVPMVVYDGHLMPDVGKRVHLNSSVAGVKEDCKQPILSCWVDHESGRMLGSSQGKFPDGEPFKIKTSKTIPPMTPEGLYDSCWKDYNQLLTNGAPEASAQIDIPLSLLLTIDLSRPKLVGGQRIMIKSFSYKVSETGVKLGQTSFKVLSDYSDGIADTIPNHDIEYTWSYINTLEAIVRQTYHLWPITGLKYSVIQTDGLNDYTNDDYPKFNPSMSGVKAQYRTRWALIVRGANPTQIRHINYEEYFISQGLE